jgi:Sec-independent protein translocase protein TatA
MNFLWKKILNGTKVLKDFAIKLRIFKDNQKQDNQKQDNQKQDNQKQDNQKQCNLNQIINCNILVIIIKNKSPNKKN